MLFPVNFRLGILDVGLLLAAGIRTLRAVRKPRLLIIPTGHELVDIYEEPGPEILPHRLIDFNSYTLMALAGEMGYEATKTEIARDRERLRAILKQHIPAHDVLVVNAGSSAGTEDFTEGVIREFGEVIFHGVAMMPGKPTIFGLIEGKPVFGIPGYPVSAVDKLQDLSQGCLRALLRLSHPGDGPSRASPRTSSPRPSGSRRCCGSGSWQREGTTMPIPFRAARASSLPFPARTPL